MRLIELTEYQADPCMPARSIWVNPACISHIRLYRRGVDLTEICTDHGSVFVLETVETVLKLVVASS